MEERFSSFLMLRPFNTVPHVVVAPNQEIISLLLQNLSGLQSEFKDTLGNIVRGCLKDGLWREKMRRRRHS